MNNLKLANATKNADVKLKWETPSVKASDIQEITNTDGEGDGDVEPCS